MPCFDNHLMQSRPGPSSFEGGPVLLLPDALPLTQLSCEALKLALRQVNAPATIERIVANDIQ
jgi:hypothetical protein